MNNNDKRLTIELMRGLANSSIDLDKAPVLKKMIQDYLHNFDIKISNSVNSLKNSASNYNKKTYDVANGQWRSIIQTGINYQRILKKTMAKEYSKNKIEQTIKAMIHNKVSQAVGAADPIIDQYFASLSDNTRKNHKLYTRMEKLEKRQDRADKKQNQTNSRFWYGIAITIIVTTCVCWIAL